jgi:hypothetical protein
MTRGRTSAAWLAGGAAGGGLAGALAAVTDADGDGLRAAVRATGNGTFVAFAAPFALRAGRTDRRHWWAWVGAHATHLALLACTARRHRTRGSGFSATSRYGGALGYATVALLGATSYAPGGAPHPHPSARRMHRAGEQFLFGLYGFTIAHGYAAKGRNRTLYGPLAALWLVAAARGRARWNVAAPG